MYMMGSSWTKLLPQYAEATREPNSWTEVLCKAAGSKLGIQTISTSVVFNII